MKICIYGKLAPNDSQKKGWRERGREREREERKKRERERNNYRIQKKKEMI